MRTYEISNMEKKANNERIKREKDEQYQRKLKQDLQNISLKRVAGFFGDCVSSDGVYRRSTKIDQRQQQKLIDEFTMRKLQSVHSFNSFENQCKEWERLLDNGHTFSHLSKQYPMKKEWSEQLTLSKQREKDRIIKEKKV